MTRPGERSTPARRPAPEWRRPAALRRGDRVAVVAPASPFHRADLDAGLAELHACGFEPVLEETLFLRSGYVAGDPRRRAEALLRAWHDESIRGIVAARGGYGSVHLLTHLDAAALMPRIFVGASDLTSLQIWLLQRAGIVTFQGPMVAGHLSRGTEGYDRDVFLRALTEAKPLGVLPTPRLETLVPGEAAGPIVGGTLAQLGASLGTPYAFDPPDGCILFLEDVREAPYRLDRLVTQLRLSGVLGRAAGIVLGTFPACDEPQCSARDTLAALFAGFPGPVVFGLPVGHAEGAVLTLPLGVRARVAADATPRVIIEEAAVREP